MAEATVTFEELDREHRRERARDAERLLNGEITPRALQEENSFLPMDAEIRILDFAASLTRAHAARK